MSPVKKPARPEGGQNRSPLEDRRFRLALAVLLAVLLYTHEPAPASEEPLSQSSEN